jgi:hypothetical protein
VKKTCNTYRYVIRLGPQFVAGGITDDLAHSRSEMKLRWPRGRFFQVGDKTSLDEAQAWAKKNGFASTW